MYSAKTTTDHQTIKHWVEARGGCPAHVKGTGSNGYPGVLRIDYPGLCGVQTLEPIDWRTFFDAFERNHLAFVFQDEPNSRFSKFIERDDPVRGSTNPRKRGPSFDAIELLEQHHREVEWLFEAIRQTNNENERAVLFADLSDMLAAHTKVEETLFYPAVCDDATLAALRGAVDEHLAIKRMVVEMLDMPPEAGFMARLDELQALVYEHIDDEEQVLFPIVRAQDVVDLETLGHELDRRFSQMIDTDPRWLVPEETAEPALLPC